MKKPLVNFAFIDAQNLYLSLSREGLKTHSAKVRTYLAEKYGVRTAYMFMGYLPKYKKLYEALENAGYTMVYKKLPYTETEQKIKGDCDVDMAFQIMKDWNQYEKAVLVTADCDFYRLINHLIEHKKLGKLLAPSVNSCSYLLKRIVRNHLAYVSGVPRVLIMQENGKSPYTDGTT